MTEEAAPVEYQYQEPPVVSSESIASTTTNFWKTLAIIGFVLVVGLLIGLIFLGISYPAVSTYSYSTPTPSNAIVANGIYKVFNPNIPTGLCDGSNGMYFFSCSPSSGFCTPTGGTTTCGQFLSLTYNVTNTGITFLFTNISSNTYTIQDYEKRYLYADDLSNDATFGIFIFISK